MTLQDQRLTSGLVGMLFTDHSPSATEVTIYWAKAGQMLQVVQVNFAIIGEIIASAMKSCAGPSSNLRLGIRTKSARKFVCSSNPAATAFVSACLVSISGLEIGGGSYEFLILIFLSIAHGAFLNLQNNARKPANGQFELQTCKKRVLKF